MSRDARSPLVLVVDDDRTVQLMAAQALEQAGYRTRVATSGTEALALFERERPALVVLDVVMPGLDGFQTCAALRADPAGAHVPVLMMTGRNDVGAIHRAFDVGATDFIAKPIPWPMLGYRVRYMLRAATSMAELARSEAQLQAAQRAARLGHWDWAFASDAVQLNEMSRLLLCPAGRAAPQSIEDLVACAHAEDRERLRIALRRAAAAGHELTTEFRGCRGPGEEPVWLQVQGTARLADDGVPMALTGTLQDISEIKRREAETRYLAYFDPLTGLPNRISFVDSLERELATARRHARLLAVLLLDLDHFKRINETLGHAAGDELLSRIGERLQAVGVAPTGGDAPTLRGSLARMGGDEYALLLSDLAGTADAERTARRLLAAVREPIVLDGHEVVVTASLGIALFPLDGDAPRGLMASADAAMYQAKRDGGDSCAFSNKPMRAAAATRLTLEVALRRALDREQFCLQFQPTLDLTTGTITGAEALLRWHHPDLGLVPPLEFIPLAEETGLILPIGEWVLRSACRQARDWAERGLDPFRLAINLSARQFRQRNLADTIQRILSEEGIAPTTIEFEITEGTIMRDLDVALDTMNRLRALGCGVAVDDFGTGYSSLAYIKRFPVHTLKIDRTFVAGLPHDADDAAIVNAVIGMAHGLNVRVVAEGVETARQLTHLAAAGCDVVQGFLVSRPLDPDPLLTLASQPGDGWGLTSPALTLAP